MMKRSNHHRREQQKPLLMQEAPVLSDDMMIESPLPNVGVEDHYEYDYNNNNNNSSSKHSSNSNSNSNNSNGNGNGNKKTWRKRLFRGKKKKTDNSNDSNSNNNNLRITPSQSNSNSNSNLNLNSNSTFSDEHHQPKPNSSSAPEKQDDSTESTNSNNHNRNPVEETTARTHTPKKHQTQTQTPRNHKEQPSSTKSKSESSHRRRSTTPTATATATATPTVTPSSQTPRAKSSLTVANILQRPFGRESVPANNQMWIVQVAQAEWEPEESLWKYRITIQKRLLLPNGGGGGGGNEHSNNADPGQNQNQQVQVQVQDYTNGFTFRSLADFYWLEQALTAEFHGGLLLPRLSIALGVPDLDLDLDLKRLDLGLTTCQHEVDAKLLTHWLSDVLNGIRGQGELILTKLLEEDDINDNGNDNNIDLITAEAMEAFLYRTDLDLATSSLSLLEQVLPQNATPELDLHHNNNHNHHNLSNGNSNNNNNNNASPPDKGEDGLWKWMYPDICGASDADVMEYTNTNNKPKSPSSPGKGSKRTTIKNRLNMVNCSSGALGDARSFNVQEDSFVEASTFDDVMNNNYNEGSQQHHQLAIHWNLLQAEKELVWTWRTRALLAMEKVRVLQEQEKHVGLAWKRFAISVSNLFAYEKDVESARLGDSKNRKDLQIPFRKLQKSAVDDCLRIIARQKVDRSTPSLDVLSAMLSAYAADLSAVQPSIQAYLEGLQQLSMQKQKLEVLKTTAKPEKKPPVTLTDQIQAGLLEVKKQLVAMQEDVLTETSAREEAKFQQQQEQLRANEHNVLINEALLKEFLTILCKTAPIRTARMASSYLRMEHKQCVAMHGAAVNMKSKVNVASKETLSKMMHRHHNEIKEDRATEMQLVQRIVNIENTKRFNGTDDDGITEEVERGVEINKDIENEEAQRAKLRDNALNLCRERIGRWDAKLAMAIMETVGVSDANVRVEETTRDLRIVRKYAIGLRENVQRCVEALDVLKMSILQGGFGDIRDLRFDFMTEMQNLFSATYMPTDDAKTPAWIPTLHNAGIRLNDPSGWRKTGTGTCGGSVKAYMDDRESGTEWLLECLGELLKEYNQRVEAVESFVYMECVGIQLEKNFSQTRAAALSSFEKKTDITSAINIATRKRMPVLVKELQAKLESVGADVSHTTVKEAKEAHLESKTLKQELHNLATRRLNRSRETSTERAITLMTVWSKEEEGTTSTQMKLLEDLMAKLEKSIGMEELAAYLVASPAPRL